MLISWRVSLQIQLKTVFFFSVGSVHVKTSVSLMLGSVVNTLEQRGEWLNGGRGAAKGMIDRPSANRVTPMGAAEHLEFWSR